MNADRRFPAPWRAVESPNTKSFGIVDATGQRLAYLYYEDEPGRSRVAGLLTRDEARRIAANIAKLPDLIKPPGTGPIWPRGGMGIIGIILVVVVILLLLGKL